ncbi:MAG: hypothetical protein CME68_04950 [Halobacteriovoraceae bacterium]|nr:hypothetical protein [Halobacteriovoraceae bacterium]
MRVLLKFLKNNERLFLIATSFLAISIFLFNQSPLKAEVKNQKVNLKAIKGALDLSSTNEYKENVLDIKGEWTFFSSKFLKAKDIVENKLPQNSGSVYFPGILTDFPLSGDPQKKFGPFGYGSFLLKVSGVEKGFPFGFEVNDMSSNFDLMVIQGKNIYPMGGYGKIGTNKNESISQFGRLFGDFTTNGDDFYILIRASNYYYRDLGMIGYLKIGPKKLIQSNYIENKLRNFFTLGILLIVAIIHLGIYFQRKDDKGSLWFSFFCFIMLFRFLSIKSYFDVLFPYPSNFSFYFNRKVEFMSFYFGGPIFLEFLRYLFKDYIPKALMKLLWSTSTFFGLIVLFTSPPVFYKTLNTYQIITLLTLLYMMTQMVRAAIKNVPHSRICLLGLSVFFFGVGWDILLYELEGVLPFIELAFFTSIAFVFIQSHIISIKFSEAYKYAEELNKKLEEKVASRTKVISNLFNSLKSAVFAIDKDLTVIPPCSEYSKSLFKKDIAHLKFFDIIFPHSTKNDRRISDLTNHLKAVFGDDELNYSFVEANFPQSVVLNDPERPEGKSLKLSYSPFYNEKDLVERIMVIIEDVTEYETYYKEAKLDQVNYWFMKEIVQQENKYDIFDTLENSLKEGLKTIDDFLSPQSDEYTAEYFLDNYKKGIDHILSKTENLSMLSNMIHVKTADFDYQSITADSEFSKGKNERTTGKSYFQGEVTEKMIDIVDYILSYISCAKNFENKTLNIIKKEEVEEKINDLKGYLKNIFEKTFLVRDIKSIDKDQLGRMATLAKLYPNFDHLVTIIGFKSKVISLYYLALEDDQASKKYSDFSGHLKQLPVKDKLTGTIINQHLIIPSKSILS